MNGSASASAVKSFSTTNFSRPSALRVCSIENSQTWLVIFTQSPVIGLAMAIAAARGRGAFSWAR